MLVAMSLLRENHRKIFGIEMRLEKFSARQLDVFMKTKKNFILTHYDHVIILRLSLSSFTISSIILIYHFNYNHLLCIINTDFKLQFRKMFMC